MKDNLKFLVYCKENNTLEKLVEIGLISSKKVRNINMFFKYDSFLRSGHNSYNSVFLTARYFDLSETQVYRIVKAIERNLQACL